MASADTASRGFPSAAGLDSPYGVELQMRLAILVTALGIASVLAEASPVPHPLDSMCIDLIFGLSLWTQVALQFYLRVYQSPVMQPIEVRALSRGLSRGVYLLLYVLMFARQAIPMLSPAWRGGAVGYHRALWSAPQGFPPYLVYGLAALVLIKGLTAWWNREVPRTARDAAHVPGGAGDCTGIASPRARI